MNHRSLRALASGLALAVIAAAGVVRAESGLVIVANPTVMAGEISSVALKSIYLGETTTWDDGHTVRPAMLAGGPVFLEFLKSHVKKAPSHFGLHWKKAIFTGTGTPPVEFPTEAELLAYVVATQGAIGFVSTATPLGAAKILSVK